MAETKEYKILCIVCPLGCEMQITQSDGELHFAEGICRRGQEYARQEIYNPCRLLTTTVKISSSEFGMLPVRTSGPIPKGKLGRAMQQIAEICVAAPVELGDVVCEDVADTGVSLVASRTISC